jgi:hypothetical protein
MNQLLKKEGPDSRDTENDFEPEEDGWMIVQDLIEFKHYRYWRAHSLPISNCIFSNSGTQLLTCPKGATSVTIWDLATSELNALVALDRGLMSASILGLAFDSTDSVLSLTTNHGTTHIYHLKTPSKRQSSMYKIRKRKKEERESVYTANWLSFVDGSDCLRLLSADNSGSGIFYEFRLGKDKTKLSIDLVKTIDFDFSTILDGAPESVAPTSNGIARNGKENKPVTDSTSWHAHIDTDVYTASSRPFWSVPNIFQYHYDETLDDILKVSMGQPSTTDLPQSRLVTFYSAVHPPHGYHFISPY